MSIVGVDGKPISNGPTGRRIVLEEHMKDGKRIFIPEIQGQYTNMLEIPKILARTIDWVCVRMEEEMAMARANDQVKAQMEAMKKEEGK